MNINKVYSELLIKRFKKLLKKKGWTKFRDSSDKQIFFGLHDGQIGKLKCVFDVSLDRRLCALLYLKREEYIPDEKRKMIAEYLAYANYGLLLGNFEIDLNDGEVRYKSCLPAGKAIGWVFSAIPSSKELLHVVDVAVHTVIRYFKGIEMLLTEPSLSPREACDLVEDSQRLSTADIIEQISRLPEEERRKIQQKLENNNS